MGDVGGSVGGGVQITEKGTICVFFLGRQLSPTMGRSHPRSYLLQCLYSVANTLGVLHILEFLRRPVCCVLNMLKIIWKISKKKYVGLCRVLNVLEYFLVYFNYHIK